MRIRIALFLGSLLVTIGAGLGETITDSAVITTNLVLRLCRNPGPYTNQFSADELIVYHIIPTNGAFYRKLPVEQSFDFRLLDSGGREVTKTKSGVALSRPVRPPSSIDSVSKLKGHSILGGDFLFRPSDVFAISNRGTYELELRLRLWAQTTNGGPNYEPMVHFDPRLGTNSHFGVVTSEVLRVKVTKE